MNTTAAPGSSHQRPQLTELNRQIVWAHGFGNNEMLQRVGECGAVTTKMLSHGLRSRWPSSRCEVCEASGQQPPVAETVVASTKKKIQISGLFQSQAVGFVPLYKRIARSRFFYFAFLNFIVFISCSWAFDLLYSQQHCCTAKKL